MRNEQSSITAWREIESAIIEYFRAEGGRILADSGETNLLVVDEEEISLSDLGRKLTDPTSCPRL
jgi:hypothetical protein